MSHVIFKGQSIVCQKKGVGHVFFINRPTYSPKRFGQSPISTSRFIRLAPPSAPPPPPTPLASWLLSYLACVHGGNSERVLQFFFLLLLFAGGPARKLGLVKLFSGQESTDPRYNSPASYAGYCLSLLVLFSQLISQRFLVYRCFPQSHMKNQKLYSIWK